MERNNQSQERKILVTFRSGRKKDRHETWQYWENVGTLIWMGAERQTAYDTAKWLMKAAPGDWRIVEPEIGVEVTEK